MDLLPALYVATQLLLYVSYYPQGAISVPHNNSTDFESLLSFKSHVIDPSGFLATNWTTDAAFCSWVGVYCSVKRQRVVALALDNFNLEGTISPYLGNLSFLTYLSLHNNSLTGHIPDDIGRLRRLKTLWFKLNYLSGPIPSSIFNMSSLITLSLDLNNLQGTLPDHVMLPWVQSMSLHGNQLTGTIPSSFNRCIHLQRLSLAINLFSGRITSAFRNLTELNVLFLGGNHLTGTIPSSMGNLTKLERFDMSSNYLEGEIPIELGNLLNLQTLFLGNNSLIGSIPMTLLNLSKLSFLDISENSLTGSVPANIGVFMPRLNILNMPFNKLTGGLEFITSLSNCRDLTSLGMSFNEMEGILPSSIGNLSAQLQYINLGQNHIKGKIPAEIVNLSSLSNLDLRGNELTGVIPLGLSRLDKLEVLFFHDNRLDGVIPYELGLLTRLSKLFLDGNKLSGSIPDSLGNVSGLQHLSLSGNKLQSRIPISLWNLKGLLYMNLSGNNLDDRLPQQAGNLSYLDTLDLSKNWLSGNISTALGFLQMLAYLDLSENSFDGQIPQSFGGLVNVGYLNLSHNFLTGSIPKSLANLRSLGSLDLSYNKLEGQIPDGVVFSNVTIQSLVGNDALCGAPLIGFPPCPSNIATSNSKGKLYLLKYILPPVVTFSVIVVLCLSLMFVFCRQSTTRQPSLDRFLHHHRMVTYLELVRATNNFSDANLLGKGRVGSVYRADLDDGIPVAVKVLNLDVQGASESFDAECYALSMIHHRNLVKIINTCSNLDFKALILQFMPCGSLEKWLYTHNLHLTLLQRINIMVDMSLALEHLHHHHTHVVLHCDLKPSNVLLDENMTAHMADFGISKLLPTESVSAMSTTTPGTIGYIAPEYGITGKVSRKGDVYSFGILMLETFTRKKPTDAMFNGELSLTEWISKAHPDAILEIVDAKLIREDPMHNQQSEVDQVTHRCLSSIIELGLSCSRNLPNERILMTDVVPRLQKIKTDYLSKLANDV